MPSLRRLLLLAGLAVGTSPPLVASAQSGTSSSPPATHLSTLLGIVVDSIHYAPLVGATVLLDGTTISVTTDAQGKFRIDSIPPGDYRIAVFHPFLDTLGFSIGTQPLRMGADSVRQVVLATPSPQSIVKNACPAAKQRLGPAAIMGHVLDPDTHEPLDSVRVSIAWTDIDVDKTNISVKRMPKLREAITDADGAYMLCGVPPGVRGTIQAQRGAASTAEVPIDMGDAPLLLQSLTMSTAAVSDTTPAMGKAVLTGRVTDKSGLPLANARVTVQGAKAFTNTGPDGTFHLEGLPSGTRSLLVRRIGFSPNESAIDLANAKPVNVVVSLDKAAPTLDAVKVEGKLDAALRQNGFLERQREGMGYFLGPDDIANRHPQQLSSLFQMIPGFKIVPGVGTGYAIRSSRGGNGCVSMWVDGVSQHEFQPGALDTQLPVEQIMAIETYSASEAPMQYVMSGQSSCAVVVIWTNRTIQR